MSKPRKTTTKAGPAGPAKARAAKPARADAAVSPPATPMFRKNIAGRWRSLRLWCDHAARLHYECSKKKRNLPPSSRAATVGLVECAFGAEIVDLRGREAEDLAEDLGVVRAHQRRGAILLGRS